MKPHTPHDQTAAFEQALKKSKETKYRLRLYVAGATPKSIQALTNLKRFCEAHLKGRYILEVIDIYQQPVLARGEQIIAAPTLIKRLPLPLRRMIGTMADEQRILLGLDLQPAVGENGEMLRGGEAGTRRRGEAARRR
jgi:circadian clock protein KaiB